MFTITFEFERNKQSIDLINAALANLRLSRLAFKSPAVGYTITTQQFNQKHELLSVSYGYGFSSVQFECEQADGVPLHCWQIDAEVLPGGEIRDCEMYHELWNATHPDRVIRFLQQSTTPNNGLDIFIVFHHEKDLPSA